MRRGSERAASRRGGRPERPEATRALLPRIIIVCEGKRTEPLYFQAIKRAFKLSSVEIEEGRGSSPLLIVQRAVDIRNQSLRSGYKSDEVNVWTVYDGDYAQNAREDWAKARRLADQNHINEAITTPCFELWYLLHFCDQTAHITTTKALERLAAYIHNYEKSKCYYPNPLAVHTENALRRAAHNRKWAEDNEKKEENYACAAGVAELVKLLHDLRR